MNRSGKYLIDSMIAIWAIKNEGQQEKIEEAKEFIRFVDNLEDVELLLPTPVVTEILSPYKSDDEKLNQVLREIQNHFIVLPFDLRSSLVASRLLNEYQKDQELRDMLTNETGLQKNLSSKIKFDIQIVSIAIANNMAGIISEERNAVLHYAKGRIEVLGMNKFMNEGTLLDNQ